MQAKWWFGMLTHPKPLRNEYKSNTRLLAATKIPFLQHFRLKKGNAIPIRAASAQVKTSKRKKGISKITNSPAQSYLLMHTQTLSGFSIKA